MDEAIQALADYCNLSLVKLGEIYVFSAKESSEIPIPQPKVENQWFLYQGTIIDHQTKEPLPYSKITLGNTQVLSNDLGQFSVKSKKTTEILRVSYLGYYVLDSVLHHSRKIQIALKPSSFDLKVVEIQTKEVLKIENHNAGENAGHLKFNEVSTNVTPGGGSNIMFNYIRLYPGVLATGESLSEYSVWGSYQGQNHIIFDGITLFNSAGLNDNIGRTNPAMIKNIEVHKAGYNVGIGDRVGAVMLIDGKQGNRDQLEANINVSSQVANGYLNIPLFNNSSTIQFAGRFSYFNLFDDLFSKSLSTNYLKTDYKYTDLNFKFSSNLKNGDYLQISSMYSNDAYFEQLEESKDKDKTLNGTAISDQFGNSLKYMHNWTKGGYSVINIAHSFFNNNVNSKLNYLDSFNNKIDLLENRKNSIAETTSNLTHHFSARKKHGFVLSLGYVGSTYTLTSNNNQFQLNPASNNLDRLSFFVQDRIHLSKRFNALLGFKIDLPLNSLTPYFQPRINTQWKITENFNCNMGWGLYNQFIGQTSVVSQYRNLSSVWQIYDNDQFPVLSAMHSVLGFSYLAKKIDLGVEGFYINTSGMSRIIEKSDSQVFFDEGVSRSYGTDFYIKYRVQKHELWASYTLSKVEEKFPIFTQDFYKPALQNQLHELKLAGTFNFHPFYISTTHVFGSGFNNSFDALKDGNKYNRTDIAFQYRFQSKRNKFQTGFSILNILNNKNIRLYQFANFPDGGSNSALGIPFTATVYLNVFF